MVEEEKQKTAGVAELVGHFSKVIAACLIMMWGVINLVHNVLSFRAMDAESSSMWVTWIGIVVTGLIPLFFGIKLLSKATLRRT